ncbi:MAG TPA: SEC-C metal-binding domain-containing protein [Pseudobdellovibrionaceae bacterium]|jgi:hypothetical protein
MPIIQLQNDPSKSQYPAFLVIPAGEFADQRFDMQMNVCDNPTCTCTDIHIALFNQKGGALPIQFKVDLDLKEKVQTPQGKATREDLLAKTVAKSFDKSDWKYLWSVFSGKKAAHTSNFDPHTTYYPFPMSRDIEEHSELVAFSQVFPHAEKFIIELSGETILLDEQYCLTRGCACDQVLAVFILLENENGVLTQKNGEAPTMFLSHRTGTIGAVDVGDFPEADLRSVLNAFLAKTPDLMAVFKKRHEQLSIMYEEYWRRNYKTVQAKTPKIGRNEACPCGSGKKFKKCCMLSALGDDIA